MKLYQYYLYAALNLTILCFAQDKPKARQISTLTAALLKTADQLKYSSPKEANQLEFALPIELKTYLEENRETIKRSCSIKDQELYLDNIPKAIADIQLTNLNERNEAIRKNADIATLKLKAICSSSTNSPTTTIESSDSVSPNDHKNKKPLLIKYPLHWN